MTDKEKIAPKRHSSGTEIEEKIKGMFYILQTSTEKFLEELDRSYELYKIGEKTEIAKKLEEIAKGQRVGSMETELISKLIKTLNTLGKKVVIEGFIKNSDYLEKAFLLSENESRILYGLVPKKDQETALRNSIGEFYSQTSDWEMFKYTEPLFQVIPIHLIDKVTYLSSIK